MEKLMSRKEAASILGISTKTLDRMVESGEISCRRVPIRPKFTRSDIEEFLERKKQSATAAA